MSETNNNMDRIFRDKLGNYRETPPEESWYAIHSGLVRNSSRRAFMVPWRIAAGIAALVTTGMLYYFMNRPSKEIISEGQANIQELSTDKLTGPGRDAEKTIAPTDYNIASAPASTGNEKPETDIGNRVTTRADHDKSVTTSLLTVAEVSTSLPGTAEIGRNILSFESPVLYIPAQPQQNVIQGWKKQSSPPLDLYLAGTEETIEKDGRKDLWSLAAQISPTYNYRTLGNRGDNSVRSYNDSESGKLCYSGGIQVGVNASNRLSIFTGMFYSQFGLEINNVYSYLSEKNVVYGYGYLNEANNRVNFYSMRNSTGIINPVQSGEIMINNSSINSDYPIINKNASSDRPTSVDKVDQYFQFFELPLMLRYRIIDRRMKCNILGGVSTNILIGNKVVLVADDSRSTIGKTDGLRTLNYSGNVGFGFDYDLGKNLLFTIEPQFKYYLNSFNEASLITNRPYSVGLFTGIKYIF